MNRLIPNTSAVAALALLVGTVHSGPPTLEMTRSTIDGGGTIKSTGGAYELSGTIGQPDAGVMTGGGYELAGGFWFGLSPTDCNDDGLVNAFDHEIFAACMTGPDVGTNADPCPCFDTDGDGDITLGDFAVLQAQFAH